MTGPATLGYLDTNLIVSSIHALNPNDPHYPRCRALRAALVDGYGISGGG